MLHRVRHGFVTFSFSQIAELFIVLLKAHIFIVLVVVFNLQMSD